jgi:phosphatidylserine/phosphatidylglycerophosphate/cardiolipin synthase-like enzyme
MKLELDATGPEAVHGPMAELPAIEAFGAKPTAPAPKLFRSEEFDPSSGVRVTPVMSPDNYMEVIPAWIKSATHSIEIEQQYIRSGQPLIQQLLESIRAARQQNPELKVRIVLARPGTEKEVNEIKALTQFGLKVGTHIRLLSPKHFVHCHNKLIIVDQTSVLVSSQNWSDSAVSKNREAGLLIEYPDIAKYFANIFKVDWDTGVKTVVLAAPEVFAPESLASGKVVPLNWGDYAEV